MSMLAPATTKTTNHKPHHMTDHENNKQRIPIHNKWVSDQTQLFQTQLISHLIFTKSYPICYFVHDAIKLCIPMSCHCGFDLPSL